MTDKERLEEIKNSYLEGIHILFGTSWVLMPKENSDWLINRVEELEKINYDLKSLYIHLEKTTERYKQILEEIKVLAEYDEYENT